MKRFGLASLILLLSLSFEVGCTTPSSALKGKPKEFTQEKSIGGVVRQIYFSFRPKEGLALFGYDFQGDPSPDIVEIRKIKGYKHGSIIFGVPSYGWYDLNGNGKVDEGEIF